VSAEGTEAPRRSWRGPLTLLALAGACALLLQLGALPAGAVERLYARGLFPPLVQALSGVARVLPFSLAEAALLVLVAGAVLGFARGLHELVRAPRTAPSLLARLVRRVVVLASGGYLVFLLVWGLNHARQPYATGTELDPRPAATGELVAAARELAARAAELRAGLAEDERGVFRARLDRAGLATALASAYARAAEADARLAGPAPLLRFPLASPLLTALGISGIYAPFTGEAHVNRQQEDAQLGFNACHEAAHARGFAREDEANYLAWRVASRAEEPELAYSAHLGALRHVAGALTTASIAARAELHANLAPAVARDWQAIDAFWQPRTPVVRAARVVSERVNDTYLRSQGQSEGTRSYGRMVDLLLAERRARDLQR